MRPTFRLTSMALLMLLALNSNAQTYFFSVSQEPYVPLGTGFPLTEGIWDDPAYQVPIGFEFELFDEVITTLETNDAFTGGSLATDLTGATASILQVYGPDIIDRGFPSGSSASLILFRTDGIPGERVFIQEWVNVGFWNGSVTNNLYNDFIHFQLKLYEASGDIVYHYGPSSIQNPGLDYEGETGPGVAIAENVDLLTGLQADEAHLLTGNPSSPTIVNQVGDFYLTGSIPENTVYRFSREPVSVSDIKASVFNSYFYPNPTSGSLSSLADLQHEITFPIRVFNSNGQDVKTIQDFNSLSLEGMSAGVYELRFVAKDGLRGQRLVVLPNE